jgi:Smr domain
MPTYRRRQLAALRQALDEARFGADRTLNLRASLPTAQEAVQRVEAWLREQQVRHAGEVLLVTGRGNRSHLGVSVVREAVARLLRSLKRRGVVADVEEHTPGSFVVRLAPMTALLEAPRRRREPAVSRPADPPALVALAPETRALLRELATRSLTSLGVRDVAAFLEAEMLKQFGVIAAGTGGGGDAAERERRLQGALRRAIEEYDER